MNATKTKTDLSPLIGERVKHWAGPVRASQPDGYHCDAMFLNGGYLWFAVSGKAVLVPETTAALIVEDLGEFDQRVERDGYASALRYFLAADRHERGRRSVTEIQAEQDQEALMQTVPSYDDGVDADYGQEDQHGIRPTQAESDTREERIREEAERLGVSQDDFVVGPQEGHEAFNQAYAAPVEPKNLAEALRANYPGFEAALRDKTRGHKSVATAFPFTSETSVRRWRAKEGVVLS